MLRGWQRRRRLARTEPGDGSALGRHRPWQVLSRSVFVVELPEADGTVHEYAVDVPYLDWSSTVGLYRDGRQVLVAEAPAAFPVPGGVVEVGVGVFGLTRMHLVPDAGEPERALRPVRHSAEYWRARLGRRFPVASRRVGAAAVVVLLLGLALLVPQLLELVTSLDVVAERVGTFTSPLSLPAWLNTTLVTAGVLASVERALTLRNHWLVDAETWWLG